MHRSKSIYIATSLFVLATLATTPVAGQSDSGQSELSAEIELAAKDLQDTFGIGQAQALETLAFQESYSVFATELEDKFRNNYAGAWISHEDDGNLHVGMTDPSVTAQAVPLELIGRVRFVKVERPLSDLLTLSEELNENIDPEIGYASPDLKANALQIETLPNHPEAELRNNQELARVIDRLTTAGLKITFRTLDALPQDAACSSPYDCSPLPGGASIQGPDHCSSGFKVKQNSSGGLGMLTARHCDPGVYSHDGINVLTWSGGASSPNADVRFLRLVSGSPLSISDDVFSFGTLKDMARYANPVLDQSMCRGGRRSSDCGVVDNLYVSEHRFRVASMNSCSGDSGGPHYLSTTGYGTHTGSSHVTQCPGPSSEVSYAVKLSHSLGWMNLQFWTSG